MRYLIPITAGLVLLTGWLPSAEDSWAESDAIRVVQNDSVPRDGVITLQVTELWRAGGDDEDYLIGLITDAQADSQGNIYLVDIQLSDVKVFTPDGVYLHTLSRQGEGPGETEAARQILLSAPEELGILQGFPPKIVWLDTAGNSTGEFKPLFAGEEGGGLGGIFKARCHGKNLVLSGSFMEWREGATPLQTAYIAGFDRAGARLKSYYELAQEMTSTPGSRDEGDDYEMVRGLWDLDSRGRVFSVPERDRYRITVQDSAGAVCFFIQREYTPHTRSAAEKAKIKGWIESQSSNPMEVRVANTAPVVHSLHLDSHDNLWIATDRSCADSATGLLAIYDIFSPDGIFVRQVRLVGPGDCEWDEWYFVADNRLVLVRDYRSSLAVYRGWSVPGNDHDTDFEDAGTIIYCALTPVP